MLPIWSQSTEELLLSLLRGRPSTCFEIKMRKPQEAKKPQNIWGICVHAKKAFLKKDKQNFLVQELTDVTASFHDLFTIS